METPKRLPITREMNAAAVAVLMGEGNAAVENLLLHLAKIDPNFLLHLDSMNMRGAQIYAAFFGFCEAWVPTFTSCVRARSPDMIQYVNQKCPLWTAVPERFR